MYRVAASVSATIVLTACAPVGGRSPSADPTVASATTHTVAATPADTVIRTPASPTVTPGPTTAVEPPGSSAESPTPAPVTELPRSARPVPPLPADLVSQPSALPPHTDDHSHDEPPPDETAAADEMVALGWVIEMTTYRADEPTENRSERLAVYADASLLTEGSLPFGVGASAPVAVWPSGAAATDIVDGVVSVEVWINTTPTSGARVPATLLTVEVTIAEGRVVGSKVLP